MSTTETSTATNKATPDPFDAERRKLQKEIAELKNQYECNKSAAEQWKRYYDENQKVIANMKEEHASFPRGMARFLLWGIFMPAWLVTGFALLVFPFVAHFKYGVRPAVFWVCVLGALVLAALFAALAHVSEGKGLSD